MTDLGEQIEKIEKEIRETPYHKGTEHHIGGLRAKLSKLHDKQIKLATKKSGGGGYAIKKQGDATVVLVGPPSVGKSTLLNKLTNAKSKIAPYEFTTLSVIPGMMTYKDARIQILDVPGLIKGAEAGKGRGREVFSVARGADLLLIMAEADKKNVFRTITAALEKNGIRVNLAPPQVKVEKKAKGAIVIHSRVAQKLSGKTIEKVAQEFGLKNAEITIKEKLTLEMLLDALSSNRVYIPAIFVINKVDLVKRNTKIANESFQISALKGIGLASLRQKIWQKLSLVRVYLVRAKERPNLDNPIIVRVGKSLADVAEKIGTEFTERVTRAKIWGAGAKYPGQEVSLSTKAVDGMQIRFI